MSQSAFQKEKQKYYAIIGCNQKVGGQGGCIPTKTVNRLENPTPLYVAISLIVNHRLYKYSPKNSK